MVIEQTPTQPTLYAELGAITHQIEQSQREVQREVTLQAGSLQILRETCPVVATATGVSDKVATRTTMPTTPLGASQGSRGSGREQGHGDWRSG